MAKDKIRVTIDFYINNSVDKMLYDYVDGMGVKSKAIKNIIFEHMNNMPPSERCNSKKEKVEETETEDDDQDFIKGVIENMGLGEAFM